VVPEEFLSPGTFEVVDLPAKVTPDRDDRANSITVVVKRMIVGASRP